MTIRLDRDPTLADELRQSIVYAAVPSFIAALAWWGWKTGSAPMPQWALYSAPLFAIVLIGFLWNAGVKAFRFLSGRAPVVEVDEQPWHPGREARIRIVHPDAGSLTGLDALLVAEDVRVETVPLTTANSGGWRFTEVVRFHASILTVDGEALAGSGPLDRTVTTTVPAEAATPGWRWQILLAGRVRRGVPREDRYPVVITGVSRSMPAADPNGFP